MGTLAGVIGGLMTAGAGWLVDSKRQKRRITDSKEFFECGLSEDLKAAVLTMDRLISRWQSRRQVSLNAVERLDGFVANFNANQDSLAVFGDDSVIRDTSHYYQDCAELVHTLNDFHWRLAHLKVEGAESVSEEDCAQLENAIVVSVKQLAKLRTRAEAILKKLER